MTVYQVLKHWIVWEEMAHGKKIYKQVLMGSLFGRKVLNHLMKDDRPTKQKLSAMPSFKMKGEGNIEAEKLDSAYKRI